MMHDVLSKDLHRVENDRYGCTRTDSAIPRCRYLP